MKINTSLFAILSLVSYAAAGSAPYGKKDGKAPKPVSDKDMLETDSFLDSLLSEAEGDSKADQKSVTYPEKKHEPKEEKKYESKEEKKYESKEEKKYEEPSTYPEEKSEKTPTQNSYPELTSESIDEILNTPPSTEQTPVQNGSPSMPFVPDVKNETTTDEDIYGKEVKSEGKAYGGGNDTSAAIPPPASNDTQATLPEPSGPVQAAETGQADLAGNFAAPGFQYSFLLIAASLLPFLF